MGSTRLYALCKTWSVSVLLLYEEHKDYLFVSESPTLSLWYYSPKPGNIVVNACAEDKSRLRS